MAPREVYENDRAAYVKRSLIELIIYVAFLACLTFGEYINCVVATHMDLSALTFASFTSCLYMNLAV